MPQLSSWGLENQRFRPLAFSPWGGAPIGGRPACWQASSGGSEAEGANPQHPQAPSVTPFWPPEPPAARYGIPPAHAFPRYETLDRTFSPLSMNDTRSMKTGPGTPAAGYAGRPRPDFSLPINQTPYPAPLTPSISRYEIPLDRSAPCSISLLLTAPSLGATLNLQPNIRSGSSWPRAERAAGPAADRRNLTWVMPAEGP